MHLRRSVAKGRKSQKKRNRGFRFYVILSNSFSAFSRKNTVANFGRTRSICQRGVRTVAKTNRSYGVVGNSQKQLVVSTLNSEKKSFSCGNQGRQANAKMMIYVIGTVKELIGKVLLQYLSRCLTCILAIEVAHLQRRSVQFLSKRGRSKGTSYF